MSKEDLPVNYPDWIQVTEKLPEDYDEVWTCKAGAWGPERMYYDEGEEEWYESEGHEVNGGHDTPPTHWFPIIVPELPKA
jgi:hypothetical protein